MNYDWLAGLIDGEGSFNIRIGERVCCLLAVQLRADDLGILTDVRNATGIGRIEHVAQSGTSAPGVRWVVSRKQDCQALVRILDQHPLRTRKKDDYAIWRQAVDRHRSLSYGVTGSDPVLADFKAALEHGRKYTT